MKVFAISDSGGIDYTVVAVNEHRARLLVMAVIRRIGIEDLDEGCPAEILYCEELKPGKSGAFHPQNEALLLLDIKEEDD